MTRRVWRAGAFRSKNGAFPGREETAMNRKVLIAPVAAIFLAATAAESEAKRVGGGRTAGASKPASTASSAKKPDDRPVESRSAGSGPTLRTSSSPSSQQPQPSVAPAAAAGALAGTVAGSAVAAADPEARKQQDELARKRQEELAALQKRFDDEAKLRRMDAEQKRADEAARIADEARKREQQEAQKRAALERDKEARRARAEREAQCQIRPVMTDEDIAKCRALRN
jgi:Skp family chaperone for outer membrane proteins